MEQLCYKFLLRTQRPDQAKAEMNNYRDRSTEYGDYKTEPDVEDYLKRMLAERIKRELDLEFGLKGVLSLSECWNSPLMWSHYADSHRGICLELDTTDFRRPDLKAVNYRAARSVRASDLLKWKKERSPEAKQRVFDTYFLAKAGAWRYEKEWRDVKETSGPVESEFSVTAIHFGLRCDMAVIQAIVKLYANETDVKIYSIYPGGDSFRLKRSPVDRTYLEASAPRIPSAIEFKDVFLPDIDNDADEIADL